ncbi:hypothetical protein DDD64_02330 [Actinotignum sanguinis]|uniref:LysR family transcriptional regulator n=1 Tax=Actinotignum sanguinis TaxID=1445614 RepID=UPI000F7E8660|nr:LysR family transcriptional regulator [Actinotignum sanguinis]MDY5148804.1 LysR family transcriptional regulator [Actinotignum sanguinis]RTE51119.1 hypothetical protein DDD64_02330 [Actinotignum sanguinis]
MKPELLETLIVLSRVGTMEAVAKEMGCTSPAIVKRIQALEEEVGQKVVERRGRRGSITPAGWRLIERGYQILALMEETTQELRTMREDPHGTVMIAGRESSALDELASIMGRARARYPGIGFSVKAMERDQIAQGLSSGAISFAVLDASWDSSQWETLPLPTEDKWGLLVPAGSDLAELSVVYRANIVKRAVIMPAEPSRELGYWLGKHSQLTIRGTYSNHREAQMMVKAGVGEALVLENASTSGVEGLVFVPLDWLVALRCVLAWDKSVLRGRAMQAFLEEVRAWYGGGRLA